MLIIESLLRKLIKTQKIEDRKIFMNFYVEN